MMHRIRKYNLIISLFLCVTICLSLYHISFTANDALSTNWHVTAEGTTDTNQSINAVAGASASLDGSSLALDTVLSEKILVSSLRNMRTVFRYQQKDNQLRNYIHNILAILFKIAFIPTLLFVIMGLCLNNQTPLWQLILQFIQNKDGKKKSA